MNLTLKRLEEAMSPERLPPLEPPRQIGTDPKKPVWAIGFVTATSPEVCMDEAIKSRETRRILPPSLARIPWC